MKKVILTVATLFALGFANAQDKKESGEGFSKGDVFITGSFNVGSSKYTANGNYKENTFSFSPKVGYFVSENIALGLGLGFATSKVEENEGDEASKVNTTSIEAFGRYYATPGSKFSLFGQLSVGYATVDYDAFKVNAYGVELAPGVSYFLNDSFAMEASWGALSYASAKADVDGAENSNEFNLGLDLSAINLGLVYKF
jgi:hypothetical protein